MNFPHEMDHEASRTRPSFPCSQTWLWFSNRPYASRTRKRHQGVVITEKWSRLKCSEATTRKCCARVYAVNILCRMTGILYRTLTFEQFQNIKHYSLMQTCICWKSVSAHNTIHSTCTNFKLTPHCSTLWDLSLWFPDENIPTCHICHIYDANRLDLPDSQRIHLQCFWTLPESSCCICP